MTVKPSEEIRATKEWLMEHGWTQAAYGSYNWDEDDNLAPASACLMGAHGLVVYEDVEYWASHYNSRSRSASAKAIYDALPNDDGMSQWESVEHFNDVRGRTLNEIIDVLDKAEKLALVREEPL